MQAIAKVREKIFLFTCNISQYYPSHFQNQAYMKKVFLSVFMLAIAGFVIAQKTISDPNAETRNVGSFHGIEVATGIKLVLTEGTEEAVAVSAASLENRDRIITRVENGILKIYYEKKIKAINRINESKNLRAYVSYKKLDRLNVNTGASVQIEGVLSAPSLTLNGNTGGIVNGKVDIATLQVSQSTGSKITLSGKTENLETEGDTGSKFFGEDLQAVNCSANISTGAKVYITVQQELNVKASTGGSLRYKGNAGVRDIKVSTGGRAIKI